MKAQDHGLAAALDNTTLLPLCKESLEKKTPGKLATTGRAALRVHGVTLAFSPRERDESVVV